MSTTTTISEAITTVSGGSMSWTLGNLGIEVPYDLKRPLFRQLNKCACCGHYWFNKHYCPGRDSWYVPSDATIQGVEFSFASNNYTTTGSRFIENGVDQIEMTITYHEST